TTSGCRPGRSKRRLPRRDARLFQDARRDADRLAFVENIEPVAIERDRAGAPGMAYRAAQFENRKFLKQVALAPDGGALAVLNDAVAGPSVEIMPRPSGIGAALGAQIAADVAPIFAQQRLGLVFRMALKEDKEIFVLLCEHSNAGLVRVGQDRIVFGAEVWFAQFVPA